MKQYVDEFSDSQGKKHEDPNPDNVGSKYLRNVG